jgi:Uma2 family endonuclease
MMTAAIPEVVQALGASAWRDRAWTWQELCDDPLLSRLPFQIELDKFGRIVMSPAANWKHGRTQSRLAFWLRSRLGEDTATEVAIEHAEGTSEPDVLWAPPAFWNRQNPDRADLPESPPLVCEVLSPSNTEAEMAFKIANYLGAGAQEVWLIGPNETVRFFDNNGQIEHSNVAHCAPQEVKSALFSA